MKQGELRFEDRPALAKAGPQSAPVFNLYKDSWLVMKSCEWRPATLALNRGLFARYLTPAFGYRPVDLITRTDLLQFRSHLHANGINANTGERLGPATINRCVLLLRQILSEASLEFGFPNPAQDLRTLKVRKPLVEVFSLEQARAMIATAPQHWKPYLTVRLFSGLRAGEVNGLEWSHVDFVKRQITIQQSYRNGEISATKNQTSDRIVQLSSVLLEALRAQRAISLGRSQFVFCSARGAPVDNHNFDRRVWRPLLQQLGLPRCRPHVMRHTCASLWLSAGENPEWIAQQLGHSNTETLFRVYSRFVPDVTRHDGSAMERLLESTPMSLPPMQAMFQSLSRRAS